MQKRSRKDSLAPGKDDLIHIWGNAYTGMVLYKMVSMALALVVIVLSFAIGILAHRVKEAKPLPIFIDRNSGIAEPVSFELIDAAGEKRHESEVKDFVRNYLQDLYTFNAYTARNNLENCSRKTTDQAWTTIKEVLLKERRMDLVDQDNQGLVEVKLLVILSLEPDIRIQVTFRKVVIVSGSRRESDHVAVIKLHTVKRYEGNAHGLMVVEYRETAND